jgi:Bacterial PH domain/Protein of unknown function (DUF1648)
MIVFDTDSRPALVTGIAAIAILLIGALVMVGLAVRVPRSIVTHLLLTLALAMLLAVAWIGYHTYALVNTSYALDRNAFVIRWGPIREIVPMGDVQRVISATDIAPGLRLKRVPLPFWWIGQGSHPALGRLSFFANAPLKRQLIIVTADGNYSISPGDVEGFLEAFRARFQMGPTQVVQAAQLLPRFMTWPIWRDRLAQALVLIAIGLNALLFAIGFARYPALPTQVVLHFDALGVPDRLEPASQVFAPAVIALELFTINFLIALGVYTRGEKLAAYIAWGGSVVVQLFFLIAMITVAFTVA